MVTLKDIAKELGVSHTTVSYVLRGKGDELKIGPETKKRIVEAGKRLGYVGNEHARFVRSGKNKVVGVIGSLYGEYGVLELCGISDAASSRGYSMELFSLAVEEPRREDVFSHALESIIGHRLSGVIATAMDRWLPRLREELDRHGIPIVVLDNTLQECGSQVASDDFMGGGLAVEHLTGLGHRKIICVSPDPRTTYARFRYEGYAAAMRRVGLTPRLVEVDADFPGASMEFNRTALGVFEEKPDAVFCASDSMAVRLAGLAIQAGLKVPGDLSVVGFANLDYSRMTVPPLTTVGQPFYEMGRRSFEVLMEHINGRDAPLKIKLPVALEARGSTGPKITGAVERADFAFSKTGESK